MTRFALQDKLSIILNVLLTTRCARSRSQESLQFSVSEILVSSVNIAQLDGTCGCVSEKCKRHTGTARLKIATVQLDFSHEALRRDNPSPILLRDRLPPRTHIKSSE